MEATIRNNRDRLVAFGTIAVLALCVGVCALADAVIRVVA
jgi:hypothetical protein